MLKKIWNKVIAVGLIGCMLFTLSGTANAAKELSKEYKVKNLLRQEYLVNTCKVFQI